MGLLMIRLMICLATLLLAHGTANAFDGTGSDLQHVCSQPKGTQEHYICSAYVGGFYAGMWTSQKLVAGGYGTKVGCLPALPDDAVIAFVLKFMGLRPQSLPDPMEAIVGAALVAEFSLEVGKLFGADINSHGER